MVVTKMLIKMFLAAVLRNVLVLSEPRWNSGRWREWMEGWRQAKHGAEERKIPELRPNVRFS